ncbi:hypothetical protein A4X06_0g7168 [Tilletia controversa]|uniref:HMG box domain-containing protein n=1 Tax=Tilletia controversa TaxID=13291 RepID=A0A8X7MME9_9BASI|nr:hypothetical protein CF328_g6224 [Tilletia controversa]KAE8242169.1 hypothetical protein A4X06_0g7168 [Tilletia controversa]
MDDQTPRKSPPRPQPQPRAPHQQLRSELDTDLSSALPLRGLISTNTSNIASSSSFSGAGTAIYTTPSAYHLPRLAPPSSSLRQEPAPYPSSHQYSVSVRNEPEAGPSSQPYQGHRLSRPAGTSPALHSPGSIPYAGHSGVRTPSFPHPRDAFYQSLPALRSDRDQASSSRLPGVRSSLSIPASLLPHPITYASTSAIPLPPPPPPPFYSSSEMPGPVRFSSPALSTGSTSSDDSMGYAGRPRDPAYLPDAGSDSDEDAVVEQAPAKRRKSNTSTTTVKSKGKAKAKTQHQEPGQESERQHSEHGSESGKITAHTRKMPDGHIKRPPNAFMLFRSYVQTNNVMPKAEKDQSNASRIAGLMWRSISDVNRAEWYAQAERAKQLHALQYPNYKYKPAKREANLPKRRMKKKTGAEEHCVQIADVILRSHGLEEGVTNESPAPRSASKSKSASPDPTTVTESRGVRRARNANDEGTGSPANKRSRGNDSGKGKKKVGRQQSAASESEDDTADEEEDDQQGKPESNKSKRGAAAKGKGTSRTKRATATTSSKRKNSVGYVIPPARKRSPGTATSAASTATINPPQPAPSPSLSSSAVGGPSPTFLLNSRPFSAASSSSGSTGLGIGFGHSFGTAGAKGLGARLGIGNFAEPISPTTIPSSMTIQGMQGHTSDELMFREARGMASRVAANSSLQISPQGPPVPFVARSLAFSPQFNAYSMVSPQTEPIASFLPSTAERSIMEGSVSRTGETSAMATSSGPFSKLAALGEADVARYAPELFTKSEEPEETSNNVEDDAEVDETDGFAAALAASHFAGIPSATPAAGPSTAAVATTSTAVEATAGPPEKAAARNIFSPPVDACTLGGKLFTNVSQPRPSLHDMTSANENAERRRSVVTDLKSRLDSLAQSEAERIITQPQQGLDAAPSTYVTTALAAAPASSQEDKSRKLSEIKHDLLRQWQSSFQSGRTSVSYEIPQGNHRSWTAGTNGLGAGEPPMVPYGSSGSFGSSSLIQPTTYWSDSRPLHMSDDVLTRPGQLGIGLDGSGLNSLSMGRRSGFGGQAHGYGYGMDMSYMNMRTTGYAPSVFASPSETATDEGWMRPGTADSDMGSIRSYMAPSTTGTISPSLLHTPPVLPVDAAVCRAGFVLPGPYDLGSHRLGMQQTLFDSSSSSSSSSYGPGSVIGASPQLVPASLSSYSGAGRFHDNPAMGHSGYRNQHYHAMMSEAFQSLLNP